MPADAPLAIDGTIQRFEFALELTWKTLKRALEFEGIEAGTPRDTLRQAFSVGWIGHEDLWLSMLKDRNEASHLYDQDKALAIYKRIAEYAPVIRSALEKCQQRLDAAGPED